MLWRICWAKSASRENLVDLLPAPSHYVNLGNAAQKAGIGHVSSHTFRHTRRTWLDSVGTPVGVQQKLMRHADIRTTMNIYGDAATSDMREAHEKVVRLALPQ
jgi:integrase